jgi:hypothetical protein
MDFIKDQEIYWLHGDDHRVATILKVENDRVYLSGLTCDYWIKKSTLIKKIDKPYPSHSHTFKRK